MQRLSETQVRFTIDEIQLFKEQAQELGVKLEYVCANAALIALGASTNSAIGMEVWSNIRMRPDFRQAAYEYASIGWRVFPLAEGAKLPAIRGGHGVKEASLLPEDIEAWAKRFPHANLGIACGPASGVIVVDIDPRHGGHVSLAKHASTGHVLPPGPLARTGNGGFHHFFKYQPGITNSKGGPRAPQGVGIDIKTTGGYVVGSPSQIAPSKDGPGGAYFWEVSPFTVALPRLPIWLSTLLTRRAPDFVRDDSPRNFDNDSLGALQKFVSKAPNGNRNSSLYWSSCRAAEGVLKHRISMREAESALLREAVAIGLDQKEAIATIRSAFGMIMKGK